MSHRSGSKLSSSKKKSSLASSAKKKRMEKELPSHTTKKKLIEFIIRTAQLERKLEIIKEMLAEEEQFTPTTLFHRFDTARKGYISEKDIENFLIESGIHYKGSELKILFGRIDVNQSEMVGVKEFQNFILPNQNPKLRYQVVRRPVLIPKINQQLNEKIEWIVAKFFTEIIKQYSKLGEYNNALINSYDFDADAAFSILGNGNKWITGESINDFMLENSYELSKEELGCLVKLMDRKGVGKIHPSNFKNYLATLNLKKPHEIFDELSPIPALKQFSSSYIDKALKTREKTLKERYKDNKSYVKGMDQDGHHIFGYYRDMEQDKKPYKK